MLQGTEFFSYCLGQVGDFAKLAAHAGGKDDGRARAGSHTGASKDKVREFHACHTPVENSLRGLAHGVRLPREGRLVDPQFGFVHQPTIGRDMLTFGEQHDISRDEFLSEPALLLAVTYDARIRRQQAPERRGGLLGFVFLPETKGVLLHCGQRESQSSSPPGPAAEQTAYD